MRLTPKYDELADRFDDDKTLLGRANIGVDALLALSNLECRNARLREALSKIADFTTGYDDIAGIVCKIARDALKEDE